MESFELSNTTRVGILKLKNDGLRVGYLNLVIFKASACICERFLRLYRLTFHSTSEAKNTRPPWNCTPYAGEFREFPSGEDTPSFGIWGCGLSRHVAVP